MSARIKTLAVGRSVVGRSVVGRSVVGRSVVGRSVVALAGSQGSQGSARPRLALVTV